MKPEIWGPHAWFLLHSISLEYPENPTIEDKNNMKNFIIYFGKVIPCEKCRVNFNRHLATHPLTDNILSSKENLIKWFIDIHNIVNEMTNKKVLTYDECIEQFSDMYEQKGTYTHTALFAMILIILILLGGIYKLFR